MRPVIRWSLWERRWSVFWWALGLSIYIALNILVYSTLQAQAKTFNRLLTHLSGPTRSLFTDTGDFLSPVGYMSAKLYYLILPLLFTVLALSLSRQLSHEEEDGTLELLLARPLSRGKLLLAKLISSLTITLVVVSVAIAVTLLCARHIHLAISLWHITLATLMSLLIGLLFGAIAWLFVGIGRGRRPSIGIGAFVALGSYLVTSLESSAHWLRYPAKVLPYHYYQPSAILYGTYNWWNAAGLLAATLILLGISYWGFRRRDIG